MAVTINRTNLEGVAFDRGRASWAIVLPGAGYSSQAPLLWYARRAALAAGRNVLVIDDAFDRERAEPIPWVEERTEAALGYVRGRDSRPLLITKSITSLAAPIAARQDLPAVWLTPLIAEGRTAVAKQVLAGLRAGSQPRLLIGGSADPSWDGAVASTLPNIEILELPEADHSLEVPDDIGASLANLSTVTNAIRRFVEALD